jgi:hypothetical protein
VIAVEQCRRAGTIHMETVDDRGSIRNPLFFEDIDRPDE